ncbi:MAG: glycosyltransferase [Planctomycetota bacterium]
MTLDPESTSTLPPVGDAPKSSDRPTAWFLSRSMGRPSEVWLGRQIRAMARFDPVWVHWECVDAGVVGQAVRRRTLPWVPDPQDGPGRWSLRARNALSRNWYGTAGGERAALTAAMREDRPAVVLAHFGHWALRLLPVCNALGVPLVCHFHGMDLSSMLRNKWYDASIRRGLRSFAASIVVGRRQASILEGLGAPADRLHWIPCGVPVADFELGAGSEPGITRFVAVSRLVAWKGPDVTLRAFAEVAAAEPAVELVMIGDGEEAGRLKALAVSLGVADKVKWQGAIGSAEVSAWMRRSDVFLQSSLDHASGWFEGFGVSVAEASSTGLAVVVSRCGGHVDQVVDGQTGYLTEQGDPAAMADRMLALVRDTSLRRRLGAAGRARMASEFDVPAQVAKLENVLAEAAEGVA